VSQQQRTPFGVMSTSAPCRRCRGKGKIIHQPCEKCSGEGFVRQSRKVSASIPAGIDNGQSIILRGLGHAGKNGGPPGDLYVSVNVFPHQRFTREGSSVFLTQPISFVQAALGDELEIPTLDGKVKQKIPEGTQTGTVFRLKGLGIPHIRGKGRGDQFVTVKVITPEHLGEAQKNLLREFAKATGEAPPKSGGDSLFKKKGRKKQ
jgi:molecular chaperone DnaJ